ncbi:MAG: hypothetical protein V4613_01090 [Bacteroidota bacterium]
MNFKLHINLLLTSVIIILLSGCANTNSKNEREQMAILSSNLLFMNNYANSIHEKNLAQLEHSPYKTELKRCNDWHINLTKHVNNISLNNKRNASYCDSISLILDSLVSNKKISKFLSKKPTIPKFEPVNDSMGYLIFKSKVAGFTLQLQESIAAYIQTLSNSSKDYGYIFIPEKNGSIKSGEKFRFAIFCCQIQNSPYITNCKLYKGEKLIASNLIDNNNFTFKSKGLPPGNYQFQCDGYMRDKFTIDSIEWLNPVNAGGFEFEVK